MSYIKAAIKPKMFPTCMYVGSKNKSVHMNRWKH